MLFFLFKITKTPCSEALVGALITLRFRRYITSLFKPATLFNADTPYGYRNI